MPNCCLFSELSLITSSEKTVEEVVLCLSISENAPKGAPTFATGPCVVIIITKLAFVCLSV